MDGTPAASRGGGVIGKRSWVTKYLTLHGLHVREGVKDMIFILKSYLNEHLN